MKKHIKNIAFMTLITALFTACNKEDLNMEKAMQVLINGYNGGSNALQLSIDTTQYGPEVAYGKYTINPASIIGKNLAYTYRADQKPELKLTDVVTKQVVYRRELPSGSPKGLFNFVFLEGRELEINPPASDPATNKLGFYIYYPTSNAPFDIFLYRRDNSTGQEFRAYLAKNVSPGNWVYIDYTATASFASKSLLSSSVLYFTKAGTTDQWAFDNDQARSSMEASGLFLPTTDEKGLVQPYFIKPTPNNQGLAKLFFYAERP